MSKIQDDKNKWVQCYNGNAPPGTLVGGQDTTGEPIYVARAIHRGYLIPGKLVSSHHCASISWDGSEIEKKDYEVLVGVPYKWIPTYGDKIPPKAIPGGKNSEETLYIGRARYQARYTPGEVQKSHGVCYITFDGKVLQFSEYEILTY